jgi:hypothetical protein
MLRFLALLVLALPSFAQSGTITVPLAMTNSATALDIPRPGPGKTRLWLYTEQTAVQSIGLETDEQIADGALYSITSRFSSGWTIKSGAETLCSRRQSWTLDQTGECVPFDGVYDGAGASGWTAYPPAPLLTSADVVVPIPAGPLVLRSEARTSTTVGVQTPIPGFGSLTYITHSYAGAVVHYEYLN